MDDDWLQWTDNQIIVHLHHLCKRAITMCDAILKLISSIVFLDEDIDISTNNLFIKLEKTHEILNTIYKIRTAWNFELEIIYAFQCSKQGCLKKKMQPLERALLMLGHKLDTFNDVVKKHEKINQCVKCVKKNNMQALKNLLKTDVTQKI